MSCVAGKQGLNPLPSWFSGTTDPLRSGKQSLDSHPFLTTRMPGFAREVLLWNRMKAKSFVTKDLVTLGIYQFDSSRLAWSTKIHSGHSNLTSPRRKVQEAPCWCGDFSPNHERSCCCCGPFPFQNLPPQKYLRGVEHAIPAVHSRRGYSVISVGSLGVLKQIKLTAAVGVILPTFHSPFIQRKWVYCHVGINHWFQEIMNYFGLFFLLASTKQRICNMWKKAWDQGWIKWDNFCKAAWSSLEDQRWELSRRNRWSFSLKKSLQDAEQIHQKLQGLQTLSRHRESLRPFFLDTWWKDYCTLQHVFDWVELNQSMSCHKQILEGRCFLSGEVQTFAQFPRYLVESQVFTLYMFPLKSCNKKSRYSQFPPTRKPSGT